MNIQELKTKKIIWILVGGLLILISFCLVYNFFIYECEHEGEWKVISVANCTSNGLDEWQCKYCGEKKNRTIDALGHQYTSQIKKEATCVEYGTETLTCSVCNDSYDKDIEKKSHSLEYNNPGIDKCKNCSYTSYETACIKTLSEVYKRLKDPSTAQINSIRVKEDKWQNQKCIAIVINLSAKNSFGVFGTEEYLCLVTGNLVQVDLMAHLEERAEYYRKRADYYDSLADSYVGQQSFDYLMQSISCLEQYRSYLEQRKTASTLQLSVAIGGVLVEKGDIITQAKHLSGVFK